MFILGIQGIPRGERSRTRMLMEWVLAGAFTAGAEIRLINCADHTIIPCTACEACYSNGWCVHEDDFPEIYTLLRSADGIILGSPVYLDHISGQMKVFLDRLSDAVHYQILGKRYGCSIATTYISGGADVVSYLNHVINYLGAVAVTGLSVPLEDEPDAILQAEPAARDLGRRLVRAIIERPSFPEQEAEIADNREFFKNIVEENRYARPEEYDRWVTMGWMENSGRTDDTGREKI